MLKPLAAIALVIATPAAAVLSSGARAPAFTTRGAAAGQVRTVDLARELRKGPVVLYFFPAAFTSGCNAEARAFADAVPRFRAAGATVIGMSADDVATLQRFSAKECAGKFTVASAGPRVIAAYDVALGDKFRGRSITSRTSYVIARDGRVVFAHDDPDPKDHVRLTLAAVERLRMR